MPLRPSIRPAFMYYFKSKKEKADDAAAEQNTAALQQDDLQKAKDRRKMLTKSLLGWGR